jgi:hypothetical protein
MQGQPGYSVGRVDTHAASDQSQLTGFFYCAGDKMRPDAEALNLAVRRLQFPVRLPTMGMCSMSRKSMNRVVLMPALRHASLWIGLRGSKTNGSVPAFFTNGRRWRQR